MKKNDEQLSNVEHETLKNKQGVYFFKNIKTNKIYVGQSKHVKKRIFQHIENLNKNKDGCKYLQNSWNKHGEDAFIYGVLEYCPKSKTNKREIYWIKKLKSHVTENGYNISYGGNAPMKSLKHSDETKLKISLGNKGKILSQETKDKISAKNKGRKSSLIGIPLSPEHREKMSKTKIENKSAKGENNAMYGLKEINHPKFGKKNPYSTSKYYGVSKRTRGNLTYWRATVDVNGKRIEIGQRKSEVEAATIYNQYVVVHKLKNPLNDL